MKKIIKESELMLFEIKPSPKGQKRGKGILTLDESTIYFTSNVGLLRKEKQIILSIPIRNIRSVNATKYGAVDALEIRYEDGEDIRTARFSKGIESMMFFTDSIFSEWSQEINKVRGQIK